MAVSKQPPITPETSSGEGLNEEPSRSETKWKRFHPFRVVRKIFRRRVKRQGTGEETSKKSWSTSELQSVQDTPHKYEVPTPPYKIGLSVSHDSIFSPESSNLAGSEDLRRPQGSSLSVQHAGIKSMFKDELFSRVRARRDSDDDEEDEDVGLPHSPCTSPTTVDVLKSKTLKSGSLSAGSLVSMGSSENDEDSALASSSGNSSRMSLLDRRSLDFEGDPEFHQPVPLNHQAAHHKIAVRPKRTHGLPQKRLKQKLAASRLNTLPTTIEVMEDNCKVFSTKKQYQESTSEGFFTSDNSATVVSSSLVETSIVHNSSELVSEASIRDIIRNSVMQSVTNETHVTHKIVTESNELEDTQSKAAEISKYQSDFLRGAIVSSSELPVLEEPINTIKEIPKDSLPKFTGDHSSFKMAHTEPLSNLKIDQNQETGEIEETPIRVSALVKNIERSDSMSKPARDITQKSHYSNQKSNEVTKQHHEQSSTLEHQDDSTQKKSPAFKNKSETASTTEREESSSLAQPMEHFEIDIRHMFQQQQKASKYLQEPNQSLMSNSNNPYTEEESIMNDKFVCYEKRESQSSSITEARNTLTVDKSFNISSQPQEKTISPNFFDGNISNVVINSLQSNVFNQKIVEDKVTISINSNSIVDDIKGGISKVYDRKPHAESQVDLKVEKSTTEHNTKCESSSNISSFQSKVTKSDSTKPPLRDKTKKNMDPSKRVSVEIVPFNQRMKDQKYQPLIFPNKGTPIESGKSSQNVPVVERNLSDRRVNSKNKESDKSNNRHSFSGTVEIEKPLEKKPVSKPVDKLHYPVQIRIHKNKTFEKENFDNSKVHKEVIKKSPSPDRISHSAKVSNEGKQVEEGQKKWEVKVHSTSSTKREAFVPVQSDEGYKSSVTETEVQDQETIQDRTLSDCTLSRNRENNKKSTPDAPQTEDMEPELLRVFARRSIKQKHCDKEKPDVKKETPSPQPKVVTVELDQNHKVEEPHTVASTTIPPSAITSTKALELQESTLKSPDLVKKKSKSFCEKDKQGPHVVVPLKDSGILRRPSLKAASPELENFQRRQRIASEPDVLPLLPPSMDSRIPQNNQNLDNASLSCQREHLNRGSVLSTSPSSTISNGSSIGMDSLKDKDTADLMNRDGSAPSWLQLAQQRRELREQRERLLIGSSTNSFLEASGKPSRSSKVWDMVNNFQKLQMT